MIIYNGELRKEPPLRVQMLTGKMRPVVIAAKAIFQKAIIEYAKTIPEPTIDNLGNELSIKLLGVRDEFFKRNPNPPKKEMMEAAFKILIEETDHNDEYKLYWADLIKLIGEM